MNILLTIIIAIEVILGVSAAAYLTLSLPVILIWKISRKIRYGISIMK